MVHDFWESLSALPVHNQALFLFALAVAFGFEFINGFHDTANAVTTVIYTKTLRPTPAVVYSGVCNFLGVMLGGTAVAFSIVNLLPVDLLIESASARAIVMVVSLLLAGVIWNLTTWWQGLPVSSSHTLIGSILGVGLANSLMTRGDLSGVNWEKAGEIALSLLISPLIGFAAAVGLLLTMRAFLRDRSLFEPPAEGAKPPGWVRGVLLATCGGVSLAHGSNDGQKGMGLVLLALIGFMPTHYSLDLAHPDRASDVRSAVGTLLTKLDGQPTPEIARLRAELQLILERIHGVSRFTDLHPNARWELRRSIFRVRRDLAEDGLNPDLVKGMKPELAVLAKSIEYVPKWIVVGVALALGAGTMVGYQRIVVTVAEKIGKQPLTYAQGATAEMVAAATIGLADFAHLPVSTTQVLSSGVAGTMWANRSGVQPATIRRIGIAWLLTVPASILLSAGMFLLGGTLVGG